VLLVRTILGSSDEARFVGRRIERLSLTSVDASKRRFRSRTESGTDVAVDLARGSYLEDGAVLFDDGERIVVVEREPEDALIIRLSRALEYAELVRQAASIGHAFGNQHVPLELVDGEIHVPITTSREVAAATARGLHLEGADISFGPVPFGRKRPLNAIAHGHHG
jgi:urease accessory protein